MEKSLRTAAVISYSSYHNAFIKHTISELRKFCEGEIVVVSWNRFFNDTPDRRLKRLDETHVILKFDPTKDEKWHHNMQRKAGYDLLQEEYDAVFFLDSDEIPRGSRMKQWLGENPPNVPYRFASNWYYRDTCYKADQLENSFAMVPIDSLKQANWFDRNEREGFAYAYDWNRETKYQEEVLADHYSWAGTKEMLLQKVRSWGHRWDEDWEGMLEREFEHEFMGCPFRPHYTFTKIKPPIGFTFNEKE